MTKVYVLMLEPRTYDDDRVVLGVFSTYDGALNFVIKTMPECRSPENAVYGKDSYDIEEYDVVDVNQL